MIFKRLLQTAILVAPVLLCFAFFQALMANPHHTESQAWAAVAGLIILLSLLMTGAVALVIYVEDEIEVDDKNKSY